MRRSNFLPPPQGQPRGQWKNMCHEKGWGTRKKGDFSDYIVQGKEKISDVPEGARGGGMGSDQFYRRITYQNDV